MTEQPKICKNCKHHDPFTGLILAHLCKRKVYKTMNPVTGEVTERGSIDCSRERTDYSLIDRIIWREDSCGKSGKYYEAKEPNND